MKFYEIKLINDNLKFIDIEDLSAYSESNIIMISNTLPKSRIINQILDDNIGLTINTYNSNNLYLKVLSQKLRSRFPALNIIVNKLNKGTITTNRIQDLFISRDYSVILVDETIKSELDIK